MGAVVIEVCAPCRHQIAGMAQAVEKMFVQAFVAQSAIEALDEPVLHRFAWSDVVPVNLAVFLPFQDCV